MNQSITRGESAPPMERAEKRQRTDKSDCCPVCLVEFAPVESDATSFPDGKIILPCKHSLHEDCLQQIRENPKCPQLCPLCRDSLPLTAAQRAYNSTVEKHLHLLQHVSECSEECSEESCKSLGWMIKHARTCLGEVDCNMCTDLFCLISIHSRRCCNEMCRVPLCSFFAVQSHLIPIIAVRLAKDALEHEEDFGQSVDRGEDFMSFVRRPFTPPSSGRVVQEDP